ncbi:ABC transporter permease [Falsochrobactrum shanghaiense]|uniref:ABC transporter permease n=1 Tax=Falsochrobactrum shanghaiense TaxID=2201899 RepID=A0A316J9B4_9HYPH|nr:amino acid ABC transporter permease [Falsochrobactrum shanghaiense]PWL18522.1 ABC transporter permease [Falsochrobactrum shanghaiense]
MASLNFRPLWRYEDTFIEGIFVTLKLALMAGAAGLLIGLVCALLLGRGNRYVTFLIRAYIEVIRNTPPVLQIFIIFFIMPQIGLRLPPFEASVVALTLYFAAFVAEIVRSGLNSIPKAQIEAGHCLGLTSLQVFVHVVLLPALRNIYPSLTSQFILLLLGTSIASFISTEELFHTAAYVDSRTFRSFEVYALISGIYVAMVMAFRLLFFVIGKLAFRWPIAR